MDRQKLRQKCEQLFDLVEGTCRYREFLLESWKRYLSRYNTIVLYGAGYDARLAVDYLEDIIVDKDVFFVDSNPDLFGKEIYKGLRCYDLSKVYGADHTTTIILIVTTVYANEILIKLCGKPEYGTGMPGEISPYREKGKLGEISVNADFIKLLFEQRNEEYGLAGKLSHKNDLLQAMDLLEDNESLDVFYRRLLCYYGGGSTLYEVETHPQYFPTVITQRFSGSEVFLDCGAAFGDSVEEFRTQTNDKFQAIYSFEMDADTYNKLKDSPIVQDPRITTVPAGVSDKNQRVRYQNASCPSYATKGMKYYEEHYADVVSIDSLVDNGTINEKVTFVKMDIEGAELDALRGMQRLMQRDKPKLAICVYHKWEDLWEIPLYIHSVVPEYKFILRHHSSYQSESVLYAYLD